MKIGKIILMLAIFAVLVSCSKQEKEADYKLLQNRHNVYYLPNEKKPFTGKAVDYYQNGQVKIMGNYIDGKLQGELARYYENGLVDSTRVVDYNLLQIKNDVSYMENEKKAFTGIAIRKYENGKVSETCSYRDGKMHGEYISYHENGQVFETCSYKDGKMHGELAEYYKNGKVRSKINFKDGKEHGKAIGYYENGQVDAKMNFKDGKMHGEVIFYHENGQVKDKGNFNNGQATIW